MFEIQPYFTELGQVPFSEWFDALLDRKAKVAIAARLYRITQGNFGDCKAIQDGVWEIRVDIGPGYRAYYARDGKTVVLLLCAGDKKTQQRDIIRACDYWAEWKQRNIGKEDNI